MVTHSQKSVQRPLTGVLNSFSNDSSNAKHKKSHENLVCKWVYTTVSSGPQIWLPKWRSNSADIECWSDDLFFVGQPGSYHHPVSLDTNLIGFSQCFWVIAKIQLSDQQTFTIRRSKKLYVGYKLTTSVVPFSHFLATTLLRQAKAHINQTPITLTSGHWNQEECNAYLFPGLT